LLTGATLRPEWGVPLPMSHIYAEGRRSMIK